MCGCCHPLLRKPINLMYDPYRYRVFIALYVLDFIFFIIRLALVSNDISGKVSGTQDFLIPILIFDLIASVPLVVCNIIYISFRHCLHPLIDQRYGNQKCWHFGTMTCIRLALYLEHPQLILLTRVFLIISFFLLRFMCFVIGASCASRFKSQCTGYTVIAAFALANFILVIVVEFIHYFRLWSYNPTDIRNAPPNKRSHHMMSDAFIEKTHRCHLRFIHHSMINDQNAFGFRESICVKGAQCESQNLHHQLIYHSLGSSGLSPTTANNIGEKQLIIAFHETTKDQIFSIIVNGLPCEDNLHLKENIYFTTGTRANLEPDKAILCARINLGRLKIVQHGPVNLNQFFQGADGSHDTVYIKDESKLHLRMPGQVEKWIVMLPGDAEVNDDLMSEYYAGCFS